ncbi:ABC transporter permease [Rhodopila globiformis]|uniref:ABC transporter permease n=1 Tax=Rhodopila globiformis TaxID=1071 RepID=A0A2S6N851_RHOGL|nr:ABC transporter permease [Rhodopila globiformis]PPQ30789.1 ABC transporter permease [Rhodopila globiformis]
MSSATTAAVLPDAVPARAADSWYPLRRALEAVLAPLVALGVAGVLFSVFLLCLGQSPLDFLDLVWRGAFGSWFSIQNTVQRAAPLLLTALCVALPGQLGLVIIGGEAAVVLGGLAATVAALPLVHGGPFLVLPAMAIAGIAMGAFWIGISGWLKARLNVNETIASLVLAYIGLALFNHLVEGVLRDPSSLNKPSTYGIGDGNMLDTVPWLDVHPGLPVGILACVLSWVLIYRTSFGFASRVTGGNVRAAQLQGLPVTRLILVACAIGGGCAGLAGAIEVAAEYGRANASLNAGYGYTGILIAFLARFNPLAIMPMALLLGGLTAAGGLLQRHMGLPDATILVLQGLIFVSILTSDTLYGRFRWFQPRGTA